MKADLSVVVVSFNTRSLLEQCLASVAPEVASLEAEVIVVDNASQDGSAEMVAASFPEVVLICNPRNRGFAQAVNQAIRRTTGRYVLLLNSDAILVPGSASELVTYLDAHPEAGAAGGILLNPDGSFQGSYARFPTLLSETLLLTGLSRWLLPQGFPSHAESESRERRIVDWVCGAFLMLRRQALDEVGLLDEAYFMYAEEVDWCRRASRAGWQVGFVPEARARHHVGGSYVRAPVRRRAQIYRSKWLYFSRNEGRFVGTAFRVLVRACSAAKLGAWALASVSLDPSRRQHARNNVASYRYLLSHL